MIIISTIENRTIQEQVNVDDGKYYISVRPYFPKTKRELTELYFALVDEIRNYSGWDRYTIHNSAKENANIATTKDLDEQGWMDYIESLRYWAISNFDICI